MNGEENYVSAEDSDYEVRKYAQNFDYFVFV